MKNSQPHLDWFALVLPQITQRYLTLVLLSEQVKLVENKFSQMFDSDHRLKFYGNVTLGKHVTFEELQKMYPIVVLACGAEEDKKLGVEGNSYTVCIFLVGENLVGVYSAREFVAWYNCLPLLSPNSKYPSFIDSACSSAVIIGNGNVALDVARILVNSPSSKLQNTDINPETIAALDKANITNVRRVVICIKVTISLTQVHIIGRRGPAQAAFTTKELRELV